MSNIFLFVIAVELAVLCVVLWPRKAKAARKPKEVKPESKTVVSAKELADKHVERRQAVKKPMATWGAAKAKLEQIDAPEQRQEKILEAHKDLA